MKVLVLTHRLPYAPNRGDRIRAYHLIRSIASYAEVDLASFVHSRDEMAHVSDLGAIAHVTPVPIHPVRNAVRGALALRGSRPLTHALLDSPEMPGILTRLVATSPPDVVLAYCSGMARFALERPLAGLPFVLDLVDVDSRKWALLSGESRWPKRMIYAREAVTLATFERTAVYQARATLVVNERERDTLLALAPGCRAHVVPNGIDVDAYACPDPPGNSSSVIFCGVMNYQPNVAAVSWFAREVWPLVLAERTDARFQVVGSSPTRGVEALTASGRGIEVTGTVPAVQPYLWGAAVSVAPLRVARGIQNKVLEALAAGVPAVVSSAVMEGLPMEAQKGCVAADTAREVATAVLGLLSLAPTARRAFAARADLRTLSWASRLADVRSVLETAAAHPPAHRAGTPT